MVHIQQFAKLLLKRVAKFQSLVTVQLFTHTKNKKPIVNNGLGYCGSPFVRNSC